MRKSRVNTPLWYQLLIDLGIDIRCLKAKDSREDRCSAPVCAKQCGNQLATKAHDEPDYHAGLPPHNHTSAAATARQCAPRPETLTASMQAQIGIFASSLSATCGSLQSGYGVRIKTLSMRRILDMVTRTSDYLWLDSEDTIFSPNDLVDREYSSI